ncbi:Cof-type HAD-IIB family hydrolase [Streptococcus macacae]|uniref:Cof-like hydrolase n=1 Tax=Streptococcus macacae NCTC 11558 TaxID=764298 RepID=G5JYL3_9STRE|nr:Cof-type HAD-IIB family hydrolase [Streptococcus macacae]EHJ52529.1 Cof-like hydrolase [Streptococcus macacae NCTC 11558]SUN78126.1 haloacid dehalogenase-like hydrolase [Streptococcus macacae NCTC 11558]
MAKIKLLALDLDGTLFNQKKEISLENKAALKAARAKDVKVVLTTGRPIKAMEYLLKELDLISDDNYIITFNGGLVQKTNGDILDKSELSYQQVENIQAEMEKLALPVDILSDGIVYSISNQDHHSRYHLANPTLSFKKIAGLDHLPRDIIYNKVVIVYEAAFLDQQILKIPAYFYDRFEVFKSRDIILEIMPKGVHKAVGLDLLVKHLGIDASEVMAMGDEENDLTMLRWAGLGVAMANGTAAAKQAADAVTARTNEQSGVAEAIEKYILKEDKNGII